MPEAVKSKPETISLDPTLSAREHLARRVVTLSISGALILAIGTVLVGFFHTHPTKPPADISLQVFQGILAIVGTWVGTVLAFYFSRENFVTAAATTRKLVGQLSDQRLQMESVRDRMIPFARIMGLNMTENMTEADITLEGLRDVIKPHGTRVPLLTRVPIFTHDRKVKYVVHQSTIYEYLVEKDRMVKTPTGERKATLKDLLDHKDFREETQRFAFVAAYSSLADAKAAMDKIDGSLDVFVTQSGQPDEPVLGWISHSEINRYGQG